MMKTISKSRFKPQALRYFREIQESGEEIIITDHGNPVLKISPFQEQAQTVLEELRNSILRYDNPFDPVAQKDWEILS